MGGEAVGEDAKGCEGLPQDQQGIVASLASSHLEEMSFKFAVGILREVKSFWDECDPAIKQGVSLGTGVVWPIIGMCQSAVELVSGKDYITGEEANRWFAAAGLLPWGKAVVIAGKSLKAISVATSPVIIRSVKAIGTAAVWLEKKGVLKNGKWVWDPDHLAYLKQWEQKVSHVVKHVPDGGIIAHDLAGGHTIIKHIDRTNLELLERFKYQPDIEGSTRFLNYDTAEKVVSEVLTKYKDTIESFVRGIPEDKVIRILYDSGRVIGEGFKKGSTTLDDLQQYTKVKIAIKRNPDMKGGYYIDTAYPSL